MTNVRSLYLALSWKLSILKYEKKSILMKNKEVLLFHDVDAEVKSFFRTYTLM